jgi:predicted NBD/HSP70 family sugar kinase
MVFSAAAPATLPLVSALRPVSDGGRRVLDLILKSGGMSQAAITRALDLAQPTVTRLLQGFQQDGMILTAQRPADRPGHPSTHVTLNPDFAYALGVSIMGDVLAMTLMDFAGRVRAERRAAMPDMGEAAVTDRLALFKADCLRETGIDPQRVIGAGVGISAFFVGEERWMNPPAYLDDWALRDVDPILERALGLPVVVDNDGTAAAIGESLFGVGRRYSDFAYLHLTNGFGGGLIADGKPLRGRHGNAGEFGGVWQLVSDAYPNLDFLKTCLAEGGAAFETVEDMVQQIDATWSGVETWLGQAVQPFTLLCAILARSFDPDAIVIGGRLPPSIAEALAQRIAIPIATQRRGRPPPVPAVVVAETPGDPVAVGAAAMRLKAAFFT